MNERLKHTRPKISRAIAGKSMRQVCVKAAKELCLTNTVIEIVATVAIAAEEFLNNQSLDVSAATAIGFTEGVAFALQEITEGRLDMSIIQVDKRN